MTREEEVKIYLKERNIPFNSLEANSIIEGAKWADQHPSVDTIKKIVCHALKYTNIMLEEDLENSVEWELLIKKAMEE